MKKLVSQTLLVGVCMGLTACANRPCDRVEIYQQAEPGKELVYPTESKIMDESSRYDIPAVSRRENYRQRSDGSCILMPPALTAPTEEESTS